MSLLLIRSRFSGSGYQDIQESGVPAWENGNYSDPNSWWFQGGGRIGFFWSIVGNKAYIQYGRNYEGWASIRMFSQEITVTNEHQNDDGSVTADVQINLGYIKSARTQYARGGIRGISRLLIGDQVVFEHNGNTTDIYNEPFNPQVVNRTVTIAPKAYSDNIQMYWETIYPNHEYPDAHFACGATLYNPSEPSYIPMATRKGGNWLGLQEHQGHILIRHGNWQDKSKENFGTQRQPNQGHNRIRKNGTWLQLPKM